MALGAPELLKPVCLLTLLIRSLAFGYLDDDSHGSQHPDAALGTFAPLHALCSKAELAIVTNRVAALAAVRVKHVLGELFRAGSGFDHAIQLGASLRLLCHCRHDAKENS